MLLLRCCFSNTVTLNWKISCVYGCSAWPNSPEINVPKFVAGCICTDFTYSIVLVQIQIFTCSLDRTTFGVSPSRLAMFTLAPCVISSFAIWSISLPLAVWSAVFPANVTLFTSAPRDIKYSATWYFPASTAWCKGVRPLLESYVRGRHTLINSWSDVVMNG